MNATENSGTRRLFGRARRAEAMLVAVTAVWGLTFSLVKESLNEISPFVFMSFRFWLAFVLVALFCVGRMHKVDRGLLKAGFLLGLLLFIAYAFQTFGLKYTSAGNAGFITGLFVVFVPVLSALMLGQRPDKASTVAIIVAVVGLGFLSLQSGLRVNGGDLMVLACAFALSLHIIYMDRYVKEYDLMLLTLLQMGVLALGNTAAGLVFEGFAWPGGRLVWTTIIVCGVFASAIAFYVQGYAQRVLSPIRTSMVLIMEPVFSVLFGIILLGETLTWRGWLGCGLILSGMVLTEIVPYVQRES
ncbi:MAG: DMT family transporter [Actinobacteria bacterium]|nr:DMT family transporter [Actinomycetota bacterium]MCG2818251.1 DMT family transporter [Actinomycetes bacterium]MBU4179420.1 DMT family transporter [Actinomycetota bacterium]MBU4219575.1 DMT family transporter [Actinomycetota bacterium]MBU4358788.1 DMT family transporter [Actinomycetota bacterium]